MSLPLSESLEAIVDRFDEAWNGPTPPRIEDFLLPLRSSGRLPLLVELLKSDMQHRLKRGERVRLEEDYLPRFAELNASPANLIDLVVHEYTLRRHEPGLSCADYLERWPRFRDELIRWFQTIQILDPTTATSPPTRVPAPEIGLPAGTPLGRYQVLKELGHGGMGIVYQALDNKRGRQVALKTIRGMSADSLYRFKREFRLRADLHHPNLVSLYELIAEEGHWFFTMELVQGSDFLRYVRGEAETGEIAKPLPLAASEQFQRLRRSLRQLVEGIEALHAAGRLHRDLKPSNVMVTPTGRVVLLDFGLMAELNPQQQHQSTTQHLLGTAAYMSPEQARSETLSPSSDWYSVGVMLYEALTGCLPFAGPLFQILLDKQRLDAPSPRSLAPDIPQDLEALCLALLSRDPSLRPRGRDCLRLIGESSAESVSPGEMHAPENTLVGRAEQLNVLADAYAALRKRKTIALFLSGTSGVGKSSLLQRFLQQLRVEGEAVLLAGQCYEQESVPYKAFDGVIDVLSHYLRHLAPLEVQALLPRDAASLLRIFPMLRRVEALVSVPRGREAPDPQEVRQRAFASLRELVARLADRKPVVICIDDLQWGDADSAALLVELIRPPDAPCLLFVGCHRREESDSPFFRALAESDRLLWNHVDRRELSLDPLSLSEAEELAARLLTSAQAKEDSAAAIARESGGNPFFVYELVRCLQAERGHSLGEGAIDLGEVLWRRIEQLPIEARELLAVAALAARPLPQDIACWAAGRAEGNVEALALLRSQRLARGTGMSGEDLLVTYHDRIRETVRAHLSAEQTRRLHGRLAEALETWGRADAEWLATHWEYAGERRRAGDYYARAANQAGETLAFDNAADLYRRALQMGADSADMRRQLQRKLGDALANAGRGGEAAEAYQVLLADAPGIEAIELQRKVTEQLLFSGHVEGGLAAAQTLLHSVGLSMPRTPARAVLGLALQHAWLWLRGLKFRTKTEEEVPALDLCRVDASWILGTSLSVIDTIRGAYFQIRNLLLSLQVGEPYRVARALALFAAYNACAGPSSHRRTARMFAISEALTNQVENPHARGMFLLASGIAAYLERRLRDAFISCSHAEDFLRSHCKGVHWELTTARAFQVWSLMYLGEIVEMNRLCSRFMKEAQDRGDLQGISNLLFYAIPMLSLVADNAEQGYQELCDGLDRWAQKEFPVQQFSALSMKIQLLLYLDRTTAVEQVLREFSQAFDRSQLNRVQLLRIASHDFTARVSLSAARGARDPAPYLETAERSAVRLVKEKGQDACGIAALIRAGIAFCKGDRDRAKQLLESALPGFVASELGLSAAAVRRRLGQLIGGDQGKSLVAEADRWMTGQGVRNPARITAVYTPGFADP